MGNFKEDLKLGERFERFVENQLRFKFNIYTTKNEEITGVDLVGDYNIECKYDGSSAKTGNYFIEFGYKGSKSGLLKYEECDFICIGDENEFGLYDVAILKMYLPNKGRFIVGGDNNASLGFLISKSELLNIAKYKYKK